MRKSNPFVQAVLARASAGALRDLQKPSVIFNNLQQSSAPTKNEKQTQTDHPGAPVQLRCPLLPGNATPRPDSTSRPARKTKPIRPMSDVQESSTTFRNLQQSSAHTPGAKNETKPTDAAAPSVLTPRQLAAARLLVLGRTARQTAREIGVEEHTIGQWKKRGEFRDELDRQSRLALAVQVTSSRFVSPRGDQQDHATNVPRGTFTMAPPNRGAISFPV
jgi:DNA-binding CsgD family transcriptional regulator